MGQIFGLDMNPYMLRRTICQILVLRILIFRDFFNASEVSSAFEIGLIVVAALTLDEAVMIADKGLDISAIAVMDVSDGADKVCTTLTDFDVKDAKVAYEESALGGYFLSKFLEYSG